VLENVTCADAKVWKAKTDEEMKKAVEGGNVKKIQENY
jgi:hypothetical protein